MLILADEQITFLKWLLNRLIYRYGLNDGDNIIANLHSIIDIVSSPIKISMSNTDLDKIISKYYVDFNMEKSENWGFTENERQKLREQLVGLCVDIMNRNIPERTPIKG